MDLSRCLRPPLHAIGISIALACLLTHGAADSVMASYDFRDYKAFEYDKTLVLQCNITGNSAVPQFGLRWYKNNTLIKPDKEKYDFREEENKLFIYRANDEDVGNYTCQVYNVKTNVSESVMKATIQVIGMPKISLPDDTPIVQGERLKLHCNVKGNPTPVVSWSIEDKAINTSDRIKFEDDSKVRNAYLIIENVTMSDRNYYKCRASSIATEALEQGSTGTEKKTLVRVKDKFAALWPFLGICAEVLILCTIILIYEKKRNKTELDESDTDQSPEQKNTPDHGKDVRQRK